MSQDDQLQSNDWTKFYPPVPAHQMPARFCWLDCNTFFVNPKNLARSEVVSSFKYPMILRKKHIVFWPKATGVWFNHHFGDKEIGRTSSGIRSCIPRISAGRRSSKTCGCGTVVRGLLEGKRCRQFLQFLPQFTTWVCLKMLCTPKPNGFADHYPY